MLRERGEKEKMICPRCRGHLMSSIDPNEEPHCVNCGFRQYDALPDIQQEIEQRQAERRLHVERRGRPRGSVTTYPLAPKRERCIETTQEGTSCLNPAMRGGFRCWIHTGRFP